MTARSRGFALLTVLWLVAALSTAAGLGIGAVRLGSLTTRNRVLLARARWAAEACQAIAEARWAERRLADTASIPLGRNTWCSWRVVDPSTRLNVNVAGRSVLERLLERAAVPRDSARLWVQAVSARRPFDDPAELWMLPGAGAFLSARAGVQVRSLLATEGPSAVNINAAAEDLLLALPGVTQEVVHVLAWHRRLGHPVSDLDELAAALSPPARAVLEDHFTTLANTVTFGPAQLVVTAEGWVTGAGPAGSLRARDEVLVVPLPGRLAVIRRRMVS